jgi:hypothetical protein
LKYTTLIVSGSHKSSRNGGRISLTVSGTTPASVVIAPSVCTYADKTYCVQPASSWDPATGKLFLSWDAGSTSEAIIRNPVAGTYTFTVEGTFDGQLLVGSVARSGRIDITKYATNAVSFVVGQCSDKGECAIVDNCPECAANGKCGWCRDDEKCIVGNALGPTVPGETCANWRYSFDDTISRRLTTQFNWPVDPNSTEVFLADSGSVDLPIELTIDIGNTEAQAWDLLWVMPACSGVDGPSLNYFKTHASDIYATLTSKNLAFSIMKYGWDTQISFVTTLSAGRPTLATFTDTLTSVVNSMYSSGGTSSAVLAALNRITDPAVNVGWHGYSKRVVLVLATQAPPTTFDFATLRQNLIQSNIVPVFAATTSLQATYQNFVDNVLGFGVVVNLADGSENIITVINKALTRVVGNVFLLFSGTGYVDPAYNKEEMNIWGLSTLMRARFVIPVTPSLPGHVVKQEIIFAPGFGLASIENVVSDRPWTTGSNQLITKEDYTVEVFGTKGYMVYVAGRAYKDIPTKVAVYLTQGPTQGSIYEFTEAGGRGNQIVVIAGTPYLVTEPQGRIIYQPNANVYSPYNEPTDYIHYKVNDGCQDSPDTIIPIIILGVNDAPVASVPNPNGKEDLSIVVQLAGRDVENDPFKYTITKLPTEATPDGTVGKLYQWNANLATNPKAAGVQITTVPINLTDTRGRMIYIPPANANSQGLPWNLKIRPEFTFHLEETSCCRDYDDTVRISQYITTQINVQAVNDPPTVWAPVGKRAVLADEPSMCFQDCTYDEDFGHATGVIYDPAIIWAGGHDIEMSDLSVVVVDVACPDGTLTTMDGQSVTIGTAVPGVQVDMLKGVFLFKPLPDEFGDAYCVITYLVNDGELDSMDIWTITININPVNDLPRLIQKDITTFEDTPIDFTIDASDIDTEYIQATFVSCTGEGTLTFEGQNLCENGAPVLVNNANIASWSLNYAPPPTKYGIQMLLVEIELNDNVEPSPLPASTHYYLTINVLAVNNEPRIAEYVNGTEMPAYSDMFSYLAATYSRSPGVVAPLGLWLTDPDVGDNLLTLTASTTCGVVSFDFGTTGVIPMISIQDTPYLYSVTFDMPLALLEGVLKTFVFVSQDSCDANVLVVFNDNGFFGQCKPNLDGTPGAPVCPLTATYNATVIVRDSSAANAIMIGGVTAAGAALGIGAALVLFKLFRKPAHPEAYNPWSMGDSSDGTTENPLYKSAEDSGENPMFNVSGSST